MDQAGTKPAGRAAAPAATAEADHPSPDDAPARVPSAPASRRRIWLASFPRSGNTFLRAVLNNCFGLPSTSVYGHGDLGRNAILERYAGHFAPGPRPPLDPDAPLLVKTHDLPTDEGAAIYVVRDGRAALVSLWEFSHRRIPLRALIRGVSSFGTWSGHLAAWQPWARPDTLLLRYEDMVDDLPDVLVRLADFLGRPVISDRMPDRARLAAADGRWVREPSDWRTKVNRRHLQLFEAVDGPMLAALGYPPCGLVAPDPSPLPPPIRAADDALAGLQAACAVGYGKLRRRLGPLATPRRLARGVRRLAARGCRRHPPPRRQD